MILVGQPELLDTLKRTDLRQFVQRISVHCHLEALPAPETAAYIRHRLSVVGGKPEIFDDRACAAVHYYTGGVPRLINLLCDQALMYGFSDDSLVIGAEIVSEVVADRKSGGLSPFREITDTMSSSELAGDLDKVVQEIKAIA
jgi:type II secretory pathway predicted ATPase ExeA